MDPKGYEKKPWFPYLKNMYDEIGGDMLSVDAKGYEEKPWWPYVLDLQEKIDAGGGGGSSDFSTVTVTFINASESNARLIIDMGNIEGYMYGFYIGEYGITSDAIELLAEEGSTVSNFFLMNNGSVDAYIPYLNGASVSVSGDIVLDPDLVEESFHLQISGSGTITYSI